MLRQIDCCNARGSTKVGLSAHWMPAQLSFRGTYANMRRREGLTMRFPNSHEPIANGIVAATAPTQISHPGLYGVGWYLPVSACKAAKAGISSPAIQIC